MTALKEYARLESTGLWRAEPEAQRRDVIVSFGNATLVISDSRGTALTHWSLPAVSRLNPGQTPAIYTPDTHADETLEIAETEMVDAIEKVRRALARSAPRPGRLRWLGFTLTAAAIAALAVFWMPGALISQTLTAVPPAKRSEIGATLLGHLQRLTGPSCRSPLGTQALSRLKARVVGPQARGQIVVLPTAAIGSLYLPGGIVVLGRTVVEDHEDPAVAAGYVAAARATVQDRDPLEALLQDAGLRATFRLLTTGELPPDAIAAHAEHLIASPPAPAAQERLIAVFRTAAIPASPYAYALDVSGESTIGLIEADALSGSEAPVVLSDADWIALQGICLT